MATKNLSGIVNSNNSFNNKCRCPYCTDFDYNPCPQPQPPTPPVIFGSFFNSAEQTVRAGHPFAFRTSDFTASGIVLEDAGTAAIICKQGYYKISYGVDASGTSPLPIVQIYVNGCPVSGTDTEIITLNTIYEISRIIHIPAHSKVELKVNSGSVTLKTVYATYTNIFLNLEFLGSCAL